MAAVNIAATGLDGTTSLFLEEVLANPDVVAGKGALLKASLTAAFIRSAMSVVARTPGKAAALLLRFVQAAGFLAAVVPFLTADAPAGAGAAVDDYTGGPVGVAAAIGDFVAMNATYVLKAAPGGGGGAPLALPYAGCFNAAGTTVSVLTLAEKVAYFGGCEPPDLIAFLGRAQCALPPAAGAGGAPTRAALYAAVCAYLQATAQAMPQVLAVPAAAPHKGLSFFSMDPLPPSNELIQVNESFLAGGMPSKAGTGGKVALPLPQVLTYAAAVYALTGVSPVSLVLPLSIKADDLDAATHINKAFFNYASTGAGGDTVRGFFLGQSGCIDKIVGALVAASGSRDSVAIGTSLEPITPFMTAGGTPFKHSRAALTTNPVVVSDHKPSAAFEATIMAMRCLAAVADHAGTRDGSERPSCSRQVDAINSALKPSATGFDTTGHGADDFTRILWRSMQMSTSAALVEMAALLQENGGVGGLDKDQVCAAQLFCLGSDLTASLDALLASPLPASKNGPWAPAPGLFVPQLAPYAPAPPVEAPAPTYLEHYSLELAEGTKAKLGGRFTAAGSSFVMSKAAAHLAMGGIEMQPCVRNLAGISCGKPNSPVVRGVPCPNRAERWHPTAAQVPALVAALVRRA